MLDLAACQDDRERIDVEAIEDALLDLRQRSAEAYDEYGEPGEVPDEERGALLDLADLLHSVTEELDQFLETGLFFHVQQALEAVEAMQQTRDALQAHIELAHPELKEDNLA